MKSITVEQVSSELDLLLDEYGWYAGNEIESSRRLVVFVEHMGKDVSELVPDILYGYQITLAFVSYRDCGDKYGVIHLDKESFFEKGWLTTN